MVTRAPAPVDIVAARRFVNRVFRCAPDAADPLAREVEARMLERLAMIRIDPARVLDAGCGASPIREPMRMRFPRAELIALDHAIGALRVRNDEPGMLTRIRRFVTGLAEHRLCADFSVLPLADQCVDFIWSNLALGATDAPDAVLAEWARVVRPGGLVFFSALGPDTLREWREAWRIAGSPERVHRFTDMHDLGDMLARAGLAEPVMEMETLTFTYPAMTSLLAEWRATGQSNARSDRPRGLLGRRQWERASAAYGGFAHDDRLPVTFEIIYGHAWKVERRADRGPAVIRFVPGNRTGRAGNGRT